VKAPGPVRLRTIAALTLSGFLSGVQMGIDNARFRDGSMRMSVLLELPSTAFICFPDEFVSMLERIYSDWFYFAGEIAKGGERNSTFANFEYWFAVAKHLPEAGGGLRGESPPSNS